MNFDSMSDAELVTRLQLNEEDALNTLYKRHAGQVLGVVHRIVGDMALAEEILQETFIRIWHNAKQFNPDKARFTAWLFSIARRLAIDEYRRQKVWVQPAKTEVDMFLMESAISPQANVIDQVSINYERDRIIDAIYKLSPDQREVIDLAYFQGKTRREIADELNIPVGTVHTRVRLALKHIRQFIIADA